MSYRIAFQHCQWEAEKPGIRSIAGSIEAEMNGEFPSAEQTLRLRGWALASDEPLVTVEARSGAAVTEAAIDQESPDVASLLGGSEGSDACRFAIEVPISSDDALEWTLWVSTGNGTRRHFGTVLLELEPEGDAVFVIGAARSGTTAIGNGLRRALGLDGYGESHLTPLMLTLVDSVHGYYHSPNPAAAARDPNVLIAHVSPGEWQARLAMMMRSVYGNLHSPRGFVDKTPGTAMIESLHVIMSIWPAARVVFSRRRGIENVESRRRKFPEQEFIGHCRDWSNAMLTWQELKTLVPEDQRLEVDHRELASEPERVAERLGALLALDALQRKTLKGYFETESPERTSSDWQPLELDEVPWSQEERELFTETCGEAMDTFGYSTDSAYWS